MYEIIISPTALKQLEKLENSIKIRILNTLERIKIRPEAYIKRLVGVNAFSLRVGDYRVIMDIDNNKLIILILKIGHRKNIYDKI